MVDGNPARVSLDCQITARILNIIYLINRISVAEGWIKLNYGNKLNAEIGLLSNGETQLNLQSEYTWDNVYPNKPSYKIKFQQGDYGT